MANPKPYVAVACFCDTILEDKDGTLSAIRIVDTYWVPRVPTEEVSPEAVPAIPVTGLIALKSGEATGSHTIRLVLENPLGVRTQISPPDGWPVVLKGGHAGLNMRLKFPLGVKNFGQCWFDVLFDDELLTKMPLRLRPAEEREQTDSQS
jgi:hypothetical protein